MTKVSFFTLGCRANQAETAVLENVFREQGFHLVDGAAADITVINSCTVTEESDRECRRIVKRACELNPGVRIAVIGCQAQVQREKLLAMPNVRWVVGNAAKMRLAEIILADTSRDARLIMRPIRRAPFTMPIVPLKGRRTRAHLKIQDGCDNFCAYCEVPYARGRARSRVFEDVMAAGRALVAAGHQEIVLTGVNLALYTHEGRGLVDVIRSLERISGLKRVRLSSVEYAPWIVELAGLMRPPHKLCRSLHIPVQSGCDRILRRMGRRYTAADIAGLVQKLSRKVPGILLGTDVIAGFPGETEDDFQQTFDLLKEQPFRYFHVFSYSARQRARSRLFKGELSPDVVRARAARLRELGRVKYQGFLSSLLGSTEDVLFEHKKDDDWFGHTDNYVTIKTKSGLDLHNRMVPVRIIGLESGTAIGKI